ncbi:MAG TPA: threonine ammonia-lyase [Hyphomicrobiaceae bacterium]|nr:threonine ammonia-lyase [Hyphomicrobiaceae bacterium]
MAAHIEPTVPPASRSEVRLADVEHAADVIRGAVVETDFDASRTLSNLFGAEIWLKFENLQFTASFKERGALHKLMSLDRDRCTAGVIAMSAGNHAQGVAYHAHRLGIKATIVMPEGTPFVKIENTRQHGAEVIVAGTTLEEAADFAANYGREHELTLIHPYDDPLIIAGQGTVALEMLRAVPALDTLLVPIGGGGLISGMAVAAKALKPAMRIVGVQAELYPSMYNAIYGSNLPMRGDTLAEGIAVKAPGRITERLIRAYVDEILLVSEVELERAVSLLIEIEKTVVEGAGAAGLAAVIARPERFRGCKVGLVLTGGNIDTRLLAGVLTRELARAGRLGELCVDLADRPGQLARLTRVIGEAGANIIEVVHQRVFTDLPAKGTLARIVVETRDRRHLEETVASIRAAGFAVELTTHR